MGGCPVRMRDHPPGHHRFRAAERIETARLVLRRPGGADADAIFSSYASDPEVTRYLAWPRHLTIEATRRFLEFSDDEWTRWPPAPT